MRFIADGPELPDELLTARDAGHVLFFCGAGVSQAEAHLPDFPSLAGRVLSSLGSALDSPARRLFPASQDFEKRWHADFTCQHASIFPPMTRFA